MDKTTEEINLKGRVEYLEGFLHKMFGSLQRGEVLSPNSQYHREVGIIIGKIDLKSTEWGKEEKGAGLLDLIKTIWTESPDQTLLELIGSCFAAGDISHIGDEELKENLVVLLDVDREHEARIA